MPVDRRINALLQILLRTVPIIPANEILVLWKTLRKTDSNIEKQVDDALESLKGSAALVERLESDLKTRMEAVQRLQVEHKQFSELSQISKEQALALSDVIATTLGRNVRQERAISLAINIVAGIIVFCTGCGFRRRRSRASSVVSSREEPVLKVRNAVSTEITSLSNMVVGSASLSPPSAC